MFERLLKLKYFIVLLHIIAWAIVLVFPVLMKRPEPPLMEGMQLPARRPEFQGIGMPTLILNLFSIPLFYINAYWLVPKYLNRMQWRMLKAA